MWQDQIDNNFDDNFVQNLKFIISSELLKNLHLLIATWTIRDIRKVSIISIRA
jgi:hypothetical protein